MSEGLPSVFLFIIFFCVTILHAILCTHIFVSLFPGFRFSLFIRRKRIAGFLVVATIIKAIKNRNVLYIDAY